MYPASVLRGVYGTTVRCDVTLNPSDGFALVSHKEMPSFEWDSERVQAHVIDAQTQGLHGHQLMNVSNRFQFRPPFRVQ